MLTYISSILFYVFGVNPGKTNIHVREKPEEQQQQPSKQQPPGQPGQQQPQRPLQAQSVPPPPRK